MNTIFVQQTISLAELRKQPAQYFRDEPVAVLSNNKPMGYVMSAALFEQLMHLAEQQQQEKSFAANFRPSSQHLQELAAQAGELVDKLSEADIKDFQE